MDDWGGKKKSISDDDVGVSPCTVDITAPPLLMKVVGSVSKDGDILLLKVESRSASLVMTILVRGGVDSGSSTAASLDDIT